MGTEGRGRPTGRPGPARGPVRPAAGTHGPWRGKAPESDSGHGASVRYDYRETISPWFRSIFYLQPDPALMTGAPVLFPLHALSALLLFAAWPFTRLVHMLTAPSAT